MTISVNNRCYNKCGNVVNFDCIRSLMLLSFETTYHTILFHAHLGNDHLT